MTIRIESPGDGVRLLTMDRPQRRNALDPATYRALAAAPAESVEVTKMLLRRPSREAVLETLDVESVHFAERRQSEHAQAAFAGFMAR